MWLWWYLVGAGGTRAVLWLCGAFRRGQGFSQTGCRCEVFIKPCCVFYSSCTFQAFHLIDGWGTASLFTLGGGKKPFESRGQVFAWCEEGSCALRNAADRQNANGASQMRSVERSLNKQEKFLAEAMVPCEMEPVASCGAPLLLTHA